MSFTEDDIDLATAGNRIAGEQLYRRAGVAPADVDVALMYDGTTAGVLLALEDWQLSPRGQSGALAADGGLEVNGAMPTNPHGGNFSEANLQGVSHLVEGLQQLRGIARCQIPGAEVAVYGSGWATYRAG